MKRHTQFLAAIAVAAAGAVAAPSSAVAQVQVDLELSLLVDVSGSVDNTEFLLQRTGYVNAFNSMTLWNAINEGAHRRIAVNYIQWSTGAVQSIGWTLIDSYAAMSAFGNAMGAIGRASSGVTGIGDAIEFATPLFANGFDGTRQVIDVSGDGCNNIGLAPSTARNNALAAGVDAINGIVINPNGEFCGGGNITAHYQNNVIGGTGSFVIAANSFDDFEAGIQNKLIAEIRNPNVVPEPATFILLGSGLAVIGGIAARRRKQQS